MGRQTRRASGFWATRLRYAWGVIRSAVAVGFIVVVGGAAVAIAQRPTRLRGEVIAADLLEHLRDKGIVEMKCQDTLIHPSGASFVCRVQGSDGSSATVRYRMDRRGSISGEQVDETDLPEDRALP